MIAPSNSTSQPKADANPAWGSVTPGSGCLAGSSFRSYRFL
jgi:hypothetical protein